MIRCLQAALSSVLIGGALLALAVPAEAVLSGKNGQIVFTSGREGANDNQAQIYLRTVVGSSGGGTLGQPVGIPGVQNRHASWSPDRTQIVFAAGTPGTPLTEEYDLFVRDLIQNTITALDVTQLGDGLSSDHPAWSPDGTRISYEQQTVDNSTQRDIMVKTVGTAAPATPLTTAGPIEFKPAWSPDSSTIYYASQQATPPASNLDILKEPAGGGATPTPVANATGVDEYQPSISPDGSKICFTLQSTPGDSGTAEIYTASLPSLTGLTNLSDDATKGDINCTWSPNGNLITYVNGTFSQGRLVLERSDDSEAFPAQLEDDVGSNNFDGNPDWAPDGSPDCPDSAVTTPPDTPITIQLECVDTGPLYERTDPNGFVANDGEPQNGTLSDSVPLGNPSTVVYTPNPGFTGTDSLVFTSFDDFGFGSDDGTVTINVRVPDEPGGGGGGNAATCAGKTATIVGTDGKDKLKGTKGNDVIAALDGRDSVKAGAGNDLVCGGGGRDKLDGGGGRDKLKGGPDRDSCKGGGGRDKAGCEIEKSVP